MVSDAKFAFIRRLQQCATTQLQSIRLLLSENARLHIREDGAPNEILIDMIEWALTTDNLVGLAQAAAAFLNDPVCTALVTAFTNPSSPASTAVASNGVGAVPNFKLQFSEFLVENFNESTLAKAILFKLGEEVTPEGRFEDWTRKLIDRYETLGRLQHLIDVCTELRGQSPDAYFVRKQLFASDRNRAAMIQNVDDALGVVSAQLHDATIKGMVKGYRSAFEHMVSGLEQLELYKQLHSMLHVLQKSVPQLRIAGTRFPEDLASRISLSPERLGLNGNVKKARTICANLPTRLQEESWIDDLESIAKELEKAWKDRNPQPLREQLELLPPVLHEMTRIDGLMAMAIYNFPVQMLIEALEVVETAVRGSDTANGDSIATGRTALQTILPRLMGLAKQHNEWQWLDKELSGIESSRDPRPEKRIPRWSRARQRLENFWSTFADTDWARKIQGHVQNWEQAVAKLEVIGANGSSSSAARKALIEECELEADQLRACTMNQFFEIDEQLKEESADLNSISQSTASLLRVLA